ncbi:MAG TPA: HAMP domain-containing sensor histidine kinase [Thermoanaerobaculia bacterium]|jgi:signal transduction histidine kinase|nr:HAMP domain-containing sensor histidine kinase [Thermoanaerobaculia bacterium]
MFRETIAEFLARLREIVPHPGRKRDRVSILVPFLIISAGLMALAWRSYNLSVRMEQGANALAEQYAGYAAEITARRVDAAVRSEMALVAEQWQQLERGVDSPTLASLSVWIEQHPWIVSALYLPDESPEESVYYTEVGRPKEGQLRVSLELFTSTGMVKYHYDPDKLLQAVPQAVKQPPLTQQSRRGTLAIQQQADIDIVHGVPRGIEKLADGFASVAPLDNPLSTFGVRAVVRTAYVGGKGWQNQRVVSLWVSLLALALTGVGASLALRGMHKESETMKLRGALIANVSHELRTPLSMIRLGAETLKRARLKDKERLDIEDTILREVLLLSHLVENVLDVARMQNQSTKALAFSSVGPRDLIRNLITTYESWIRSKGFEVELELDDTIADQLWDRDAVSRALLNLVDNAIKYSADDRHISIVLRQNAEYVIIEVKDRGIGIDVKDVTKIFDPYFRAKFSDTITRRGAGLGLTLVQQIVESHGGKVELDSVIGSGSTFRLMFPRSLASSAPTDFPTMVRTREAF